MLSRVRDHLSHLGLCNLKSKDSTHSFTLGMYLQHNPGGFGAVHRKEALQDINHELHGGIVVVDQDYLIQGGALDLGRRFLDDQSCTFSTSVTVTHEFVVYRVRPHALQAP